MDTNSLPPLPSPEELFAPSSSKSSSLPFIKNVSLFIPVPPLPPSSDVDKPPMPPMSSSEDYTDPYSPVPPQPTSPLVDRFDYQLGDNKASDSLFELKQNKSSEVVPAQELLSEPPCKKTRFSESVETLQYDSREEGEISDEEDDTDQAVISGKSTTLYHKPSSAQTSTASRSDHMLHLSGHRQVPSNSQSFTGMSPLPGRQHQSNNADIIRSHSHQHHRRHLSHSGLDGAKLEVGHHKKVHEARDHRTEKISSRHKQAATHTDGRKVSDSSKDSSRSSSHRRASSDRAAGVEDPRPSSGGETRRVSGYSHRRQSDSRTSATESAKPETSHSSLHPRCPNLSRAKGFGNDGSEISDHQASVTVKSETTRKDASETDIQHHQSSSTDQVHHDRLSSSTSRSLRLQHIHPGSTLGSEIAKNVSRSSVGQQVPADTSVAKSASQSFRFQSQLTDNLAADQISSVLPNASNEQQSLHSGEVSYSGTELQCSSSLQSKPSQSLHKQQSMHELAVMETTEKLLAPCQPDVGEKFGRSQTPNDKLLNAGLSTQSRNDELHSAYIPQPTANAAPVASQYSSPTVCLQKDLDAPYSPGSLDLVNLFETSVAPDVPLAVSNVHKDLVNVLETCVASDILGGVSNDDKAGSSTDTAAVVPCSGPDSSTVQNREVLHVNVEDSVMEIDTVDVVDELPAAVELEEPAAVEGHGQEYEVIDDLEDNNVDDADDNAAASSENSEVEFDSGEDENTPCQPAKTQCGQKVQKKYKASDKRQIVDSLEDDVQKVQKTYKASHEKRTGSLEPLDDEDGDDDFQAPLINHKIVLRGELKE